MRWMAALVLGCVAAYGCGQAPSAAMKARWVGSWATSQQAVDAQNNQPGVDAALLTDATVRQVVHLSLGGTEVRLVFSNAFGEKPLTIDSVHVARTAAGAPSSAIDPATDRAVTFAGSDSVAIPMGAEYLSDPIAMAVPALANVTISYHLAEAPAGQTAHPGSHATSWLLHGNHTGEADLAGAEKVVRWLQISAVEVAGQAKADAVVTFGDSITDGHASTTDGNDRWPDVLARRLHDAGLPLGVLNEGIGGNRLLGSGLNNGLGENALGRMDRDLFGQDGVRYVIVLEGINDLGLRSRQGPATPEEHEALTRRMIAAYEQMVMRAHAHGMKVIGATMTPYAGSDYYHPAAENEADRQRVNAWIREPGHFDAVVDFDKVVRDPKDPSRLLPAYDSGDHLHPGPKGYEAMGEAVPLGLFR